MPTAGSGVAGARNLVRKLDSSKSTVGSGAFLVVGGMFRSVGEARLHGFIDRWPSVCQFLPSHFIIIIVLRTGGGARPEPSEIRVYGNSPHAPSGQLRRRRLDDYYSMRILSLVFLSVFRLAGI